MESTQFTNSTSNGWLKSFVFSPFFWGGGLTVAFYAAVPWVPRYQPLLERYFCNHPLEYATTALFFIGISVLLLKSLGLRQQRLAFELDLIDQAVDPQDPLLDNARRVEQKTEEHISVFGSSWLLTRLQDVGHYIAGRGNGRGLEEHLKYLAELSLEELQRSYALLRTITWAVPILGFLGTVIGITMALANVNLEQIQTSPDQVASGLAVAFDTTALALTLSLGLVFGSFLVERSEQKILSQVENFGIKVLLPLFARSDEMEPTATLPGAEAEAARRLLQETENLVSQQTAAWNHSLERLQSSWLEVVEGQKNEFTARLHQGMQESLLSHSEHLQELRGELVLMVDQLARRIDEQQAGAQDAFQILMDQFLGRLEKSSDQISHQLQAAASGSTQHLEALYKQEELLLEIVSEEKELNRLQQSLSQNLELVRSADTFEETLHSLNAAVSLLTVKTRRAA